MTTITLPFSESTITHPHPGATEWDDSGATYEEALALANEHWDVCDLRSSTNGGTWDVVTRSGFCALVGKIKGSLAILNKDPDGGRTLHTYSA